jgi:hypothetical protein
VNGSGAAAQLGLADVPEPPLHDPDAGEQRRLRAAVGDHVHGDRADTGARQQAGTRQKQPDMADRYERQHALQVVLGVRHHRAEHRSRQARHDQHDPHRVRVRRDRAAEDPEHDPHDPEHAELAHRARQHDADRRRRDGVGVGEPEVERHDRRLHQEAAREERQRHHHEAVDVAVVEHVPGLRDVQRTRARVDQRDPDHRQERPDRVRHREVQRALQRRALVDVDPGERERRDAHQLEEDEQVEQVARETEADHAGEEDERQHVHVRGFGIHRSVAVEEHERHQQRDEQPQSDTQRIQRERHADRHAVARVPAAQPDRLDAAVQAQQHRQQQAGARERRGEREHVGKPPADEPADGGDQRGGQHRHGHGERSEHRHPCISAIASGSRLPKRLCACTANASNTAVTVASTTTSVSVSAWTTGSTTGVPPLRSARIGAFAPER